MEHRMDINYVQAPFKAQLHYQNTQQSGNILNILNTRTKALASIYQHMKKDPHSYTFMLGKKAEAAYKGPRSLVYTSGDFLSTYVTGKENDEVTCIIITLPFFLNLSLTLC